MQQENNLAACLKTGMKPNLPSNARQRIVAKIPEWQMLEKPWKSLALIALNEVQIPSDDDNSPTPTMMRGRRNIRSRRGGRSASGPMEWLPNAEDVLISDGSSDAYRLAVLLIRKTLFEDDWDESWDEILDGLREDVSANGVHPVWSKMAEATPILAQFASFSQNEVEEEESDKFDLTSAYIDPNNSKSLSKYFETISSGISNAKLKIALQKARALSLIHI